MTVPVLFILAGTAVLAASCGFGAEGGQEAAPNRPRGDMVDEQIERRGVANERVLDAMRRVPRHEFVPEAQRVFAYADRPLPIGHGQTISQPYIVAYMTEIIEPQPTDRVLEIGTGSGYQAAILAELVGEVYTIEIVDALATRASETLTRLGYTNVRTRAGDGYRGWPEAAPFDKIILTAAPPELPQALVDQLADGGILVAPVGRQGDVQTMTVVRKTTEGVTTTRTIAVQFVPMVKE